MITPIDDDIDENPGSPPMLTIWQVAQRLQIHESTVRRRIAQGQLPVIRIGWALRIDPADLDEWINHNKWRKVFSKTGGRSWRRVIEEARKQGLR